MQNNANKSFKNNLIFSSIFWALGLITFLSDFLGFWTTWQLSGYAFFVFIPITLIFSVIAIVNSVEGKKRKLLILNLIFAVISVAVTVITVKISFTWFR